MINYILLRIAVIGSIIMSPLTFIYTVISNVLTNNFKNNSEYYYNIALMVDKGLNVIMKKPLNRFMINQKHYDYAHKFGNPKESLSHCIGRNNELSKLYNLPIQSKLNIFFGKLLNKIDKNHIEKATKNPQ